MQQQTEQIAQLVAHVFDPAVTEMTLLDKINLLEKTIQQADLPEIEFPLVHHFAPSTYGREIFFPADSLVIGKTHRHAHLNIISKGRVTVATEHGIAVLEAPCSFVSEVGTKRAIHAHEDTVWTCIHANPSNTTDLELIESEIIVPDDEIAAFRIAVGLDVPALGQGE